MFKKSYHLSISFFLEVQNIIESLVDSRERKNDKIQDISVFTEIRNEHKKGNKPQKLKRHKKRLSRKEFKDLGLFSLPRKTLKYEDYLQLNALWNSYMEQQLGAGGTIQLINKFDPTHPQYDQLSSLIHKSDFHGARLKVTCSKCASLVGHKGIVLLESKFTFSIISKDNVLRIIPKSDSIFEMKWGKARFTVFGKHLCYKSGDRTSRKTKKISLIEL